MAIEGEHLIFLFFTFKTCFILQQMGALETPI